MKYIAIKQEQRENSTVFIVSAITLKNSRNTVVQKIPHPLGSDIIEFSTLDEAQQAIFRAGFSCVLPNGTKQEVKNPTSKNNEEVVDNYEKAIFELLKNKTKSNNQSVVATSIGAISDFANRETYDILFSFLGEENEQIRKNAISGICKYATILKTEIIEELNNPNWVVRNSILTCISKIIETTNINTEDFIIPVMKTCEDINPIVQTNAISTISKLYQNYKKSEK